MITANFDNCFIHAKKQFNFHDNPEVGLIFIPI